MVEMEITRSLSEAPKYINILVIFINRETAIYLLSSDAVANCFIANLTVAAWSFPKDVWLQCVASISAWMVVSLGLIYFSAYFYWA